MYSNKKRNELVILCKEKGIRGYSHKKKKEIIDLLKQYDISNCHPQPRKCKQRRQCKQPSKDDSKFLPKEYKSDMETTIVTQEAKGTTAPKGPLEVLTTTAPKGPLKTEDTGKMFEMAICLAYGIEYQGVYKYGMELPKKLSARLVALRDRQLFPSCLHTGSRGSRYDFTSLNTPSPQYLSAKTTKRGLGKIAPPVVGQASPEKFCSTLGIQYVNHTELKRYIQENIPTVLSLLEQYTFDCPTIYYNQTEDRIQYIMYDTAVGPCQWDHYTYEWSCPWEQWKNSSTLKIKMNPMEKPISIVEFQFHSRSRKNMAIRWVYDNILVVLRLQRRVRIVDL